MREEGERAVASLTQYGFMLGLVNNKTKHESIYWHPTLRLSKELRKRVDCEYWLIKVGSKFQFIHYEFLRYRLDSVLAGAKNDWRMFIFV